MKQIWAPWRQYIHSEKPDECIFCTAGSKDPRESLVLFAGSVSV